jgi:SPP1 gp7 family putative phage head morphogenesis protein
VERLIRDNPKLLPKYKFGKTTYERLRDKNLMWNKEKVTSAVLQGIIQGESIPKIAKRMRDVAYMDYKSSIRDARTSITSAQNAGRIEAMHRAEGLGIHQKKQWLATIDDRTRHEHRMLDGEREEIDEPFKIDGYEIMYPADPSAEPEMVYNCRCTMVTVFDGFDKKITDFDIDDRLGDMTYDEWKESRDIRSDPIDKQERQGEAMRRKYNEDYRRMRES